MHLFNYINQKLYWMLVLEDFILERFYKFYPLFLYCNFASYFIKKF